MNKNILVTGSSGLIGSEVVKFFCEHDFNVYGIDNNMRQIFFGKKGSTELNRKRLEKKYKNFQNYDTDIRDQKKIIEIIRVINPLAIVHTAAHHLMIKLLNTSSRFSSKCHGNLEFVRW